MSQSCESHLKVAIVGGGLAGMAAAEMLSRVAPKIRVTVLESKRRLGGRAGSYVDPVSGTEIDYCQHVAMGCCTNLIDLLRRCELDSFLRRHEQLTFLHPGFSPSRFAPTRWLPAPLHLLAAFASLQFLSKSEKLEIMFALRRLMRLDLHAMKDGRDLTAASWLRENKQSPETIRKFWDVILVSALGEHTDRVSLAAARKVMIDGFAIAHGASDVLVPTIPLSTLFGIRMAEAIRDRGVDIQTGQQVRAITRQGEIKTADGSEKYHAIICAVPWHRIEDLFAAWCQADRSCLPDLSRFGRFPPSPITGIHLWFDRPISDDQLTVLVGTTAQWMFRPPYQSDRANGNQKESDGHYHQVVISGEVSTALQQKEELIAAVLADLRKVFPAAERASLLRHQVVTDPNSVFSVRPDVESVRPSATTSLDWLFLAGDWTKTGWPATMEGAVISGRKAATELLKTSSFEQLSQSDPTDRSILAGLPPGLLAKHLIRSV